MDPVDVRRTLYDLDPEETLVVVISKTFTTAETMLNARYWCSCCLGFRETKSPVWWEITLIVAVKLCLVQEISQSSHQTSNSVAFMLNETRLLLFSVFGT